MEILLFLQELLMCSSANAKTLMEAIEKRFGGNTETKKVQKTHLKQQYENFTADLEEQSLNDLFNNIKIYEAEVKHTFSTGTTTQNLAFVSSSDTDSTTKSVSTAASVSTVCAKMPMTSLPNVDSLSNAVIYSFFAKDFFRRQDEILELTDLHLWVLICLKWSVITATGRDILLGSVGSYGWSYQAEEEPVNYALIAFSSSSSSFDNELSPTKSDPDLSHINRPSTPIIEDWVSDSEDESETKAPQIVPSFVQSPEQVKAPRHSVQLVKTSISAATPKPASPKSDSSDKRRNRKACFVCKSVDHLIKDCDYHAKKMAQPTPRNYTHRGNHKQYASLTPLNPQTHMVPAAVLTQSKPVSLTGVRPVSAVVPKIKVTRPSHAHPIITKSKSPIRRYITRSPSPKTSNSPPRVTAGKALVVSAAQGIKGNWVWRQKCPILDHVS
nr:hypothetical protein [Tanacetum cinerariifolium]